MTRWTILAAAVLLTAGCTSVAPAVPVTSAAHTALPTESRATGGAAIWPGGMRRSDPGLASREMVARVGDGDLHIEGFDGRPIQVVDAAISDVDVAGLPLEAGYAVLFAGPERIGGRTRLALFRLDAAAGATVRRWGEVATDLGEPHGACLRQVRGVMRLVALDRRGEVREYVVSAGSGDEPVVRETGRYRIDGLTPGCAIDTISGDVYLSDRRGGFWRHRLGEAAPADAMAVAPPPRGRAPRSHGLAFLIDGLHTYLVSLDEDRKAFSVRGVSGGGLTWFGRVAVRATPDGAPISGLGGLDAYGGSLDGFDDGVVTVVRPGASGGLHHVAWPDVKAALGF